MRWTPRTLMTLFVAAFAIGTHHSRAEDGKTSAAGELTVEQAVSLALAAAPEVKEREALVRAAAAGTQEAARRVNPTLDVTAENFAGSGEYRGADRLETTVSLSQRVELGDGRAARTRSAEASRLRAELDLALARIEVTARAKIAVVDVIEAQRVLEVEREGLATAERLGTLVTRRARAGGGSPAESSTAAVDVARAQLRLQQAEDSLDAARRRLGLLLGQAEPSFTRVTGDVGAPAASTALDGALDQTATAARWRAEHAAHVAAVSAEEERSRPDLTLSAGVRHFKEEGRVAAVVGGSLELPVLGSNRSAVQEARERATSAQAGADAARQRAATELLRAKARLRAAEREKGAIETTLVPKSTEGLAALERAYPLGVATYGELSAAYRTLLELRLRQIAVACEAQRSLVEIEKVLARSSGG